jgi:KEOPS complex subunit Pcc1
MNNCSIVNVINTKIAIKFDSEKESKIVYEAISIELETSPDYRSKVDISLKKDFIQVFIESMDMTSFRASINSIIKWINLVLDIINLAN